MTSATLTAGSSRPAVLDEQTFAAIWRDTYDEILRHVWCLLHNRLDAEDVVAETFLKAWMKRDTYNPGAGTPLQWLRQIARRAAFDLLRYRASRPESAGIDPLTTTLAEDLDVAELVAHQLDADAVVTAVRAALAGLPPRHRQVVECRYVHGLNGPETAVRMGATVPAVKTLAHRAYVALRAALQSRVPCPTG